MIAERGSESEWITHKIGWLNGCFKDGFTTHSDDNSNQ